MAVESNQIKTIFLEAVAKVNPAERAAFLEQACAGADELRRRVEVLLRAHDAGQSILDRPAVEQFAPSAGGAQRGAAACDPDALTHHPSLVDEFLATTAGHKAFPFLAPSSRPGALGRLAHYELLDVLGEGGFGTVFKAFDEKLHRMVAIKVLAPLLALSGAARQRFLREARAAAAVRHEHVVGIHVVEEDPVPYLVMELIDGPTLQQKLDRTGPLPLKEILRIGLQLANGLAAAHKQGLIHRDVKPANILLENGVECVKITDFGLARTVDDVSLSQSGWVVGTPMFMSPEQAEGRHVDQRSDLFSLGSVLYEMCTGRSPFADVSTLVVLVRVRTEMPRPIREANPDIPDWLATVVNRLLAKQPEERFQSAKEVAEVLARYLSDLQIHGQVQPATGDTSRPATADGARGEQGDKDKKKPAAAAPPAPAAPRKRLLLRSPILLVSALLCLAGAVVAAVLLRDHWLGSSTSLEDEQLQAGPGPTKGPNPLDRHSRQGLALTQLALVGDGDPALAPPELVAVLGDGCLKHHNIVESFLFRDQGAVLIAADWSGALSWWDPTTGRLRRRLPHAHAGWIRGLALSPDGTQIVTGGRDGKDSSGGLLRWWDARTGAPLRSRNVPFPVLSLAFSPDGKWLAASSDNQGEVQKAVLVLEAATGQEQHTFTASTHHWVQQLAFSPDSHLLAVAGHDQMVRLFDPEEGKEVRKWVGHDRPIDTVAFHPGGKLLATGGEDKLVNFWDPADGKLLHTFTDHKGNIAGLAFSPDGNWFATADTTGAVRLWDVTTRRQRRLWPGHHSRNRPLFSPDSRTLAVVGADHAIRLWDVASGEERLPHPAHTGLVCTAAFSPDGTLLASGGNDKTVRLWDLAGWRDGDPLPPVRSVLKEHTQRVWSVKFSPDGKLLASASVDRTIVLWDVATGRKVRTLKGHSRAISRIAFSPDGQTIAGGKEDGTVQLWDVATGHLKPTTLPRHNGVVRCVAYSPNGKLLACSGEDKLVKVYETDTERLVQSFELGQIVDNVTFSPDGKWLGATTDNNDPSTLNLWDVGTWKKVAFPNNNFNIPGLAFSPAAPLAATSDGDGLVRLWDLRDLHDTPPPTLTIGPGLFGAWANEVVFAPAGRYLATANENGTVTILKVPPRPSYRPGAVRKLPDLKKLAQRPSPADALDPKTISPGLRMQAGGGDADRAPAALVAVLGGPDGHTGQVQGIAFSVDGKLLASAGMDKAVRLWNVADGKLLHTLAGHEQSVYTIAVSPDNKVASGSDDGTVRLWDAGTGKWLTTIAGRCGAVRQVVFAPDGKTVAAALHNATVKLWDANSGQLQRTFSAGTGACWCVAFSPDGQTLASSHQDGFVRLWDVRTGWQLATLGPHPGAVRYVCFHPDGRSLITSGDPTLRWWDLTTLHEKQRLPGNTSVALSGAVRADGGLLVSAGETDGTLHLWDLSADQAPMREIALFPPGTRYLHGVALTPEGRYLATANPDGTIYILKLAEPGEVWHVAVTAN